MAATTASGHPESEKLASREMQGSGVYTANTKGCFDVINKAGDKVLEQVATMTLPDVGAFTIVDYGTADGGTSMPMLTRLIAKLRELKPDLPIVILYEDQPTNDFKPLFLMTQGLLEGPPSYLTEHKNVYVMASGTSFYAPCSPPGSVNFGFSATAMHWLRSTPTHIQSALHSAMAPAEEASQYAAQAAKDWAVILQQRAVEMAPGARAVFVNFCTDEGGRYLGNTASAGGPGASMHATFSEVWARFAAEGKITAAEYTATNFPQHYRTAEEYAEPLKEGGSAWEAGLRLEESTSVITPCPYRADWLAGKYASAEEFAADYIGTLKSWSSGVFKTGLSDSRSEEEKTAIVDAFYKAYEGVVAADPDNHGMDYVHSVLVISKA